MTTKSNVAYLRCENQPQFQHRKGPGGEELDATEAVSYFPALDVNPKPLASSALTKRKALRLRYDGMSFTVRDVTPSVEAGVYFGTIADILPSNAAALDRDQCIGFELRHVFGRE